MKEYTYQKFAPPADFSPSEKAFIAAMARLSEHSDFDSIRVVKLIEVSGYSRGTFYRKFEDKYDFAKKILQKAGKNHSYYLSACQNMIDQGLDKDNPLFIDFSCDFFRFVYNNHQVYDMLIEQKLGDKSLEWFTSLIADDGEFSDPDNKLDAQMGVASSLVYVFMWRSIGYDNASPEYMVKLTSRFFPMFSGYYKNFKKN